MITTIVHLTGLTCSACTKLCQKKLSKISEVQAVETTVQQGEFILSSQQEVSTQNIEKALAGTDYAIRTVEHQKV